MSPNPEFSGNFGGFVVNRFWPGFPSDTDCGGGSCYNYNQAQAASLVLASDVTGDGIPDVVVGAPNERVVLGPPWWSGVAGLGRVYVFDGATLFTNNPRYTVLSEPTPPDYWRTGDYYFGIALAAGDLKGDGTRVLAVASAWETGYIYGGPNAFRIHVFDRLTEVAAANGSVGLGGFAGAGFGFATSLAVGNLYPAYGRQIILGSNGQLDVFSFTSGAELTELIAGGNPDGIGNSWGSWGQVVAVGHIYNKNLHDLVVSDPFATYGHCDGGCWAGSGAVVVYNNNNPTGWPAGWAVLTGSAQAINSRTGWSLSLGDVNNDGIDDLAVGTPCGSVSGGTVDIFDGAQIASRFWGGIAGVGPKPIKSFHSPNPYGCGFGGRVALADVNGDGNLDLIVSGSTGPNAASVEFSGNGIQAAGRVYIFDLGFEPPVQPTTTSISAPTVTYNSNGIVTVTVTSPAGTPTGNVSLTVDGASAITAALTSGSATFTISGLNAGDHRLSASYPQQNNFAASSATGTLHVNPAPLTITANDSSKLLGAPNLDFTVTYSGFVPGEGPWVLSGSLTFTTSATVSSPVGTYTVMPGGLTSTNYQIKFVSGTLTITYNVCPLYDSAKPVNSGAVIPITVQLCSVTGVNQSSSSLVLTALCVRNLSSGVCSPPVSPGNSNPDQTFRFDPMLPGYVYNLKTTRLTTGRYNLEFKVTNDPRNHIAPFQVR